MVQQASSQSSEALKKSNEDVEEARYKPGTIVDKETAQIE